MLKFIDLCQSDYQCFRIVSCLYRSYYHLVKVEDSLDERIKNFGMEVPCCGYDCGFCNENYGSAIARNYIAVIDRKDNNLKYIEVNNNFISCVKKHANNPRNFELKVKQNYNNVYDIIVLEEKELSSEDHSLIDSYDYHEELSELTELPNKDVI